MLVIQLMVISAREFDSQYVMRIGIEGQSVYRSVQAPIRRVDEDIMDTIYECYYLYQFVRMADPGTDGC